MMDRIKLASNTRSKGFATVEYLIVATALISALLVPLPVVEKSVVNLVVGAIGSFQTHTTYLLSLP